MSISVVVKENVLAVPNAAPSSNNSTMSPTTSELVLIRVTRKVVVADSAAFIRWLMSTKSLLPNSASVGALGATVSSIKFTVGLAVLTLPAASMIWAVRLLGPSPPRSAWVTVKST